MLLSVHILNMILFELSVMNFGIVGRTLLLSRSSEEHTSAMTFSFMVWMGKKVSKLLLENRWI